MIQKVQESEEKGFFLLELFCFLGGKMETHRSVVSSHTRMYSIDTSKVVQNMGNFREFQENLGQHNFWAAFDTFSQDIARCDFASAWVGLVRAILISMMIIITSFGSGLVEYSKNSNEEAGPLKSVYGVIRVFNFVNQLLPPSYNIKLALAIYLQFNIAIISIFIFFMYIIISYKKQLYPSTFIMKTWIVISQAVLPFFINYGGFVVARGIRALIFGEDTTFGVVFFVLGVPLSALSLILTYVTSITYQSTPIIRTKDCMQVWYCCISFDWEWQYLIFISNFLQTLLNEFPIQVTSVIYCVFHFAYAGYLIYKLLTHFIFITPFVNCIITSVLFADIMLSLIPLVSAYLPSAFLYYIIITGILFVGSIPLNSFIFTKIMKKTVSKLCFYNYEEQENNSQDGFLINLYNQHEIYDFELLEFRSSLELSSAIRIGYMFRIEEINDTEFINWCISKFAEKFVLLSYCQIALTSSIDPKMTLLAQKTAAGKLHSFNNIRNFMQVFNDLRLGALSTNNQPLFTALSKAKKRNDSLHRTMGEFWGSALKSRTDIMMRLIPEIEIETQQTLSFYERNLRNYPNIPIVVHEMNNIYHFSIADYHKAVEYQTLYNRIRKGNMDLSATANLLNEEKVDKKYLDKMEPYVSAQDVIQAVASPTKKIFFSLMFLALIIYLVIPTAITIASLTLVNNFHADFKPSEIIGSFVYNMGRLPQLLRRKNLHYIDKVRPYIPETGPPLSVLLEFVEEDAILPSINKYIDIVKEQSSQILDLCRNHDAIKDSCSEKSVEYIYGSSVQKVTVYDIISYLISATQNLIKKDDWVNFAKDEDAISIFKNFENFYFSMDRLLTAIESNLLDRKDDFKVSGNIYLIFTFAIPFLIVVPLLIAGYFTMRSELNQILKIFPTLSKSEMSNLRFNRAKTKKDDAPNIKESMKSSGTTENNRSFTYEKMAESLSTISKDSAGVFSQFLFWFCLTLMSSTALTLAIDLYYISTIEAIMDLAASYFKAIRVSATATASYIYFQELFAQKPILNWTLPELKIKTQYFANRFLINFNGLLYGTGSSGFKPGLLIDYDILKHFALSTDIVNPNLSIYPVEGGLLHSVYFHNSCDSQIRLYQDIARFLVNVSDETVYFSFEDDFVYHFEHVIFAHLAQYFIDGRELLIKKTNDSDTNEKYIIIIFYVTNIVLLFIMFFSILIPMFLNVIRQIKTARSMLLLLPPDVLLSSQTVTKWISGMLTSKSKANDANALLNKSNVQIDYIIEESKCGLIITDNLMNIKMNNKAAAQFLKEPELKDKNLREVFTERLFESNKVKWFHQFDSEITKILHGRNGSLQFSTSSSIMGNNNQVIYLGIHIAAQIDEGRSTDRAPEIISYSCSFYDRTAEHFQEALVESEKRKSMELVSSLLPPSIIRRMNDDETDISFEVQSATVMFTSVSNWSDLIRDMDAKGVMKFLNILYSEYDKELKEFPQITKIKIIGHIYMVVAGLFNDSSVNSAEVMLRYAVRLMNIVNRLSEEMDINMNITCGVNLGGPINCGILGKTRPVFDILGDPVNVASRMNSSSLPGHIQISMATYDAIKYLDFKIKERGEIQVKGKGLMKTFFIVI
ncbi:guanylate cyclase [Tritrichomonas foetus]|uniref:Guanylate cyclase n=1 Tax=Tritrichomonas foetus TaxID=1144522 RepID=A0A1J4KTG6_9EUKA|nr:guanylate cyclase [Tritrichomonas foetus]|eukprot:OHT12958.1 guanylate cyclase [Tritrichomonas foetus]